MYAQNCSFVSQQRYPVRAYDTYGASPWENIPDVLHMYGMCSYRDWFEYLEFMDPTDANRKNMGACSSTGASTCGPASVNVMESIWWDTLRPYAETSMPTLFSTKKFQASETMLPVEWCAFAVCHWCVCVCAFAVCSAGSETYAARRVVCVCSLSVVCVCVCLQFAVLQVRQCCPSSGERL